MSQRPSRLKTAVAQYHAFCLQGDLLEGYRSLGKLCDSEARPSQALQKFKARVEARFFAEMPVLRWKTQIPWVRQVLTLYAKYYVAVLTRQTPPAEAERALATALNQDVFSAGATTPPLSLDEVEIKLAEKFTSIGWHFLGGKTHPFYGPYIYEQRIPTTYTIELPLGSRELTVHVMRNFHSLSWLDFATFGKIGTGGWAKSDGLYCVIEKYDVESESFRVNYLQHEAQHVDDYLRFPQLKTGHQAILEFRAKLVELIYAESDRAFRQFMREAKNDANYPHVWASHQLKQAILPKLGYSEQELLADFQPELAQIRQAARQSFAQNTQDLERGFCWGKPLSSFAGLAP